MQTSSVSSGTNSVYPNRYSTEDKENQPPKSHKIIYSDDLTHRYKRLKRDDVRADKPAMAPPGSMAKTSYSPINDDALADEIDFDNNILEIEQRLKTVNITLNDVFNDGSTHDEKFKLFPGLKEAIKDFLYEDIDEQTFKKKTDDVFANAFKDDDPNPKRIINLEDILWFIESIASKERQFSLDRVNMAINYIKQCISNHQAQIYKKAETELKFAWYQFVSSMVIGSLQIGAGLCQFHYARKANKADSIRDKQAKKNSNDANNNNADASKRAENLSKATRAAKHNHNDDHKLVGDTSKSLKRAKTSNHQAKDQVDASTASAQPDANQNPGAPRSETNSAAPTDDNVKAVKLNSDGNTAGRNLRAKADLTRFFSEALGTFNGAISALINGQKVMAIQEYDQLIVAIQGIIKIIEAIMQSNTNQMQNNENEVRKLSEQAKSILDTKNSVALTSLALRA